MPLYEYQCPKCGRFEVIRKFSDAPLSACPTCGREIQKLPSAPAIQFKGSGWYVTDYARKSPGGDASKGESGESAKGGESGKTGESAKGGESGKTGEAAKGGEAATKGDSSTSANATSKDGSASKNSSSSTAK